MPDQADSLTEQEQLELAVAQKHRKSARISNKQDLSRAQSQPLPIHKDKPRPCSLTLAQQQHQRQILQGRLQHLDTLPAQSKYAKHQKACILKALSLLESSR